MKIGPLRVQVLDVESKVRLVNGKMLSIANFHIEGLGPNRNIKIGVPRPVPSLHAPMFREDGSHISNVVVCRQDDPGIQAFLVFHELCHAAVWILHLPNRTHFWIEKLVRSQVLDTPCPPK